MLRNLAPIVAATALSFVAPAVSAKEKSTSPQALKMTSAGVFARCYEIRDSQRDALASLVDTIIDSGFVIQGNEPGVSGGISFHGSASASIETVLGCIEEPPSKISSVDCVVANFPYRPVSVADLLNASPIDSFPSGLYEHEKLSTSRGDFNPNPSSVDDTRIQESADRCLQDVREDAKDIGALKRFAKKIGSIAARALKTRAVERGRKDDSQERDREEWIKKSHLELDRFEPRK